MKRIAGPSPFGGGLCRNRPRRIGRKAPRVKRLQEITRALIWEHPGVIFRKEDRVSKGE